MTRGEVPQYVSRVLLSVIGMSLSVSAWLVKARVEEISDTLKDINEKVGEMREQNASIRTQLNSNTADIAQLRRGRQWQTSKNY